MFRITRSMGTPFYARSWPSKKPCCSCRSHAHVHIRFFCVFRRVNHQDMFVTKDRTIFADSIGRPRPRCEPYVPTQTCCPGVGVIVGRLASKPAPNRRCGVRSALRRRRPSVAVVSTLNEGSRTRSSREKCFETEWPGVPSPAVLSVKLHAYRGCVVSR